MHGKIFISYRRDDAAGYAYSIHDRLARRFGADRLFMDIDSIGPGIDFIECIEAAIPSSAVVLALIGRRWNPERLKNPQDFVRLELQTALERGIRVIPVLVEGVSIPPADELPDQLAPLVRRMAVEISNSRFSTDCSRLVDLLHSILGEQETPPLRSYPSASEASGPQPQERLDTGFSFFTTPKYVGDSPEAHTLGELSSQPGPDPSNNLKQNIETMTIDRALAADTPQNHPRSSKQFWHIILWLFTPLQFVFALAELVYLKHAIIGGILYAGALLAFISWLARKKSPKWTSVILCIAGTLPIFLILVVLSDGSSTTLSTIPLPLMFSASCFILSRYFNKIAVRRRKTVRPALP